MIGSRLGKWQIDKEIGRGGMGRVFLAHDESTGQPAAVKVLSAALAQEAGFLHRFQREIEVLGQLNHPNIVRLYDSGAHDGYYYFAMEYVEGESFEQILQESGRVPWTEVLDAALQIAPALKHAHDRGIIHRDLKPPNLLRTPTGIIKLTDFGIAKVFAAQQLTSTGGVVGTAEYLSPEQAAGKLANKRSDLYSLGVLLYTLLTGRTPFEGRTAADLLHKHLYGRFERPQMLVPEIPHDLDDIVCQLLEKDPDQRPPDCLVLQRQLDRVRRKVERKSERTLRIQNTKATIAYDSDEPPIDNPGPATLMSQLVRRELEQQNRGNIVNRLLNRPWVLVPLFLLCVGIIVWQFWPESRPSADWLFEQAAVLMASENLSDWDKARREYLLPLDETYPEHAYRRQVDEYLLRIEDHARLRRALAGNKEGGVPSAARRFYERALALCQQGDADAARPLWENVVRSFRDVESERRWVRLSEDALAALGPAKAPSTLAPEAVQQALRLARHWRDRGQADKATDIWNGLTELYRDEPFGKDVLHEIERDRGQ